MNPESTHKDFEPNEPMLSAINEVINNNYTLDEIHINHLKQFAKRFEIDPDRAIRTALKMLTYFHMYAAKLHKEKQDAQQQMLVVEE
jgi:hypothetical protein